MLLQVVLDMRGDINSGVRNESLRESRLSHLRTPGQSLREVSGFRKWQKLCDSPLTPNSGFRKPWGSGGSRYSSNIRQALLLRPFFIHFSFIFHSGHLFKMCLCMSESITQGSCSVSCFLRQNSTTASCKVLLNIPNSSLSVPPDLASRRTLHLVNGSWPQTKKKDSWHSV